jgi:hypothetical protein
VKKDELLVLAGALLAVVVIATAVVKGLNALTKQSRAEVHQYCAAKEAIAVAGADGQVVCIDRSVVK